MIKVCVDGFSLTAVCTCVGPLPAGKRKKKSVKRAGKHVGERTSYSKVIDGNECRSFDLSVTVAKLSHIGGTELRVPSLNFASSKTISTTKPALTECEMDDLQ